MIMDVISRNPSPDKYTNSMISRRTKSTHSENFLVKLHSQDRLEEVGKHILSLSAAVARSQAGGLGANDVWKARS